MEYTAENIQCYPIDKVKLSQYFDNLIHEQHPDNKVYKVVRSLAVVLEPRAGLINEEFIGGEGKYQICVHAEWDELDDDGKIHHCFNMFPSYEYEMNFTDITPYLLPLVSLAEFTKERRGYNVRIRNNERLWMKYFNSVPSVSK